MAHCLILFVSSPLAVFPITIHSWFVIQHISQLNLINLSDMPSLYFRFDNSKHFIKGT